MMRQYLIKLLKFLVILCIVLFIGIAISNQCLGHKPSQYGHSEANLYFIDNNRVYDYVVLGISHARTLSRYNHHPLSEKILQGNIINISQGDGLGGWENQLWYLGYFLSKGNTAKKAIIVVSPTLFYSNKIDQNANAFYREPIRTDFFNYIKRHGGSRKYHQLFYYLKSKLNHHWWTSKPLSTDACTTSLTMIDSIEVNHGMALAYPQGMSDEVFNERCLVFDNIMQTLHNHSIEVVLVFPPALFGQWPGHDKVKTHLQFQYPSTLIIDNSLDIIEPPYYKDHHHLNTKGMERWLSLIKRGMEG